VAFFCFHPNSELFVVAGKKAALKMGYVQKRQNWREEGASENEEPVSSTRLSRLTNKAILAPLQRDLREAPKSERGVKNRNQILLKRIRLVDSADGNYDSPSPATL
jgi:hypothetical protein